MESQRSADFPEMNKTGLRAENSEGRDFSPPLILLQREIRWLFEYDHNFYCSNSADWIFDFPGDEEFSAPQPEHRP